MSALNQDAVMSRCQNIKISQTKVRMSVREDVFMGWEKEERPPL